MAGRSRKRGRHGSPSAAPAPPPRTRPSAPTRTLAGTQASDETPASAETRAAGTPPPAGGAAVAARSSVRDAASPPAHLPQPRERRSEARNAEIRATLRPYAEGERPWIVIVSTLVAAGVGLTNLIAWLAGDKIHGQHPAAGGIIVFSAVLLACALGLWRMWYGAVLGFMALMAIIAVLFTLFLIEASNVLGAVVAVAIIGVSGYLFFKLVRVLSRLQMPKAPQRPQRSG